MNQTETLRDIRENPENHKHLDLHEITACCMVDGVLDLSLMQAHTIYAPVSFNGGQPCDVTEGPCSCGAWH